MSNGRSGVNGLQSRVSTIASITNALKFFALALLIVEALIGMLAVQAPSEVLTLSYLGTIMFIFVVTMVVILVLKRPDALIAVKAKDLQTQIVTKVNKVGDLGKKKKVLLSSYSPDVLDIPAVDVPPLVSQSPPEPRGG